MSQMLDHFMPSSEDGGKGKARCTSGCGKEYTKPGCDRKPAVIFLRIRITLQNSAPAPPHRRPRTREMAVLFQGDHIQDSK